MLLATLLVAVLVSFVLAMMAGHASLWAFHTGVDVLLVSYLALLIHFRNAAAEQEMTGRGLGR